MENRELIRQIWEAMEPHLAEQGYELVELEYGRQGGSGLLRFFIDKAGGGISLDDCTAVSQLLSPLLDRLDLVSERYLLEVSSPGIDRPVRKPADFRRFLGEPLRLRSVAPVEGRSQYRGVLIGFEDGLISMDCNGTTCTIHIENVKSARLDR